VNVWDPVLPDLQFTLTTEHPVRYLRVGICFNDEKQAALSRPFSVVSKEKLMKGVVIS
jgi:hypothetical protein